MWEEDKMGSPRSRGLWGGEMSSKKTAKTYDALDWVIDKEVSANLAESSFSGGVDLQANFYVLKS